MQLSRRGFLLGVLGAAVVGWLPFVRGQVDRPAPRRAPPCLGGRYPQKAQIKP